MITTIISEADKKVNPSKTFLMHATNLYDSIRLKEIRNLYPGKLIQMSPHELQIQLSDTSYLFVYRFGCLVFFNVSSEQMQEEIEKLKAQMGEGVVTPTTEIFDIVVSDITKVEFEYVSIKKFSIEYLRLIAMTLGQSAALEYFELNADKMLFETSSFMSNLASVGKIPFQTKKLLKIIGSIATTRHHIISNVSILDPPDETWKSKELEYLYRELQSNFDIDTRFKVLDKKLTLIQDNIEIIAKLTSTRTTTILEALVVILICLEITLAVFGQL